MTTESRLTNGTPVIIIQNEDGDGDPPRPPYLAMVIGYDEDWDRYEIQLGTATNLSEPADTVHPVGELLIPAVRAAVRDWNAKVTWQVTGQQVGGWTADCENSRGMSYRGIWETSLENYGEPVKVIVTQEG